MEEPPHGNPLRQLDYKQAFDQTVLYSQYHDLLTELHCDANVSLEEDEESSCDCSVDPVTLGKKGYRFFRSLLGDRRLAQRQKFERACLEKLADARQDVILRGAKGAGVSMGLSVAATVGLTKWLTSPESFGGSFAMFNAGIGAVHYTKDMVRSIAELRQPHQQLDDLEKTYAINKCFIPRQLWEKIEKNFEYARRGDDRQAAYIDFLEFALRFAIMKPRVPVEIDVDRTIHTLFERIDRFFDAYHVTPWQLSLLKINVRNFVENIVGTADHQVRYVYLVGEGGIGKSQFVEQLQHWLDECMPGSIYFNKNISRALQI